MQTEVLAWLLAGRRRRAFCLHFNISYETFRDHQRALLARAGDQDPASHIVRLFSEALEHEDA